MTEAPALDAPLSLGLIGTDISVEEFPYPGYIPPAVITRMAEYRAAFSARLTADRRRYDTSFCTPVEYRPLSNCYRQMWAVMLIDPQDARVGEVVYAAAFPQEVAVLLPYFAPVHPLLRDYLPSPSIQIRPHSRLFERYGDGWVAGPHPLGWKRKI